MLLEGTNRQRKMEFVYIDDLVPEDYILRKIDKYINFCADHITMRITADRQ